MLPFPPLPSLGWAGSLGESPLHRHSSPLYPSWQTKHGSPPDFSSSFSIIYFFSFTFSHYSLPFLCTPFILFLSVSSCPLAHRRPSLPSPAIPASSISSGHLPHRLLMLKKQYGWEEWLQSESLVVRVSYPFSQKISGYLFSSCFQWFLGSGNPKCWLALGMKKLSSPSVEEERRHSVPMPASFALPECARVVFLPPFSLPLSLVCSPFLSLLSTQQRQD